MSVTEEQLTRWAKAPSETEEEKCRNAVERITNAIKKEFGKDVRIFLQGSYKNRTNVRLDSDVDIVVLHEGYAFPSVHDLSESDKKTFWGNFTPSQYTFAQYKNKILSILEDEFDYGDVQRKNKCIRVNGNSYRVNADVVPCFLHERHSDLFTVSETGIEFVADDLTHVNSFPEQHYQSGSEKNTGTDGMYKSVVRILKNVRNDLLEQGVIKKDDMPSFFLECLAWNVLPNIHFQKDTYWDSTRAIVATIWNEMRDSEKSKNYAEVSDLKWLFKGNFNRTPKQAEIFMHHAWDFMGYEN